ncbi:bud neck involved protein [Coemansia sp. RSA 2336]|nr:bud neck involved protein [Coemansia sp. RSA 2336]
MPFLAFTGKDSSRNRHEHASQQRGLKKWLSIKVSNDVDKPHAASHSRHSAGMTHARPGNGRGKPAAKTLGIRNRLSLPVSQRLHRKSLVGYANAECDIRELPEILEFRLNSPIPSPNPALTPPPTFEADRESAGVWDSNMLSLLEGLRATEPLQSAGAAGSKHASGHKRSRGKQRPPLRKRSLMYAMYCTAQPEDADRGSPMGSVVSATNGSATFVSCTSMPSIDSRESIVCQPVVASGQYSQSQQASDMSIGFMLVDAVEHLASMRQRDSAASDCESISSSSSSSSSKYVCAEHTIIDTNAYRCGSKHAPRLSIIERAQDGRLLLKPTTDKPVDSGHTSTADASPKTPDGTGRHTACLENFPPFPDISPRRRAREPVNSLLIHASKLEAACPEACSIAGMSAEQQCEPLARDMQATPPDSPEQESVASGNASEGTTVSTAENAGNTEAGTALAKSHGKQYSESACSSPSSVKSETIGGPDMAASSCSETQASTANESASPPGSARLAHDALQDVPKDLSYDSMAQLTDSTCRDSNLCSLFSDISDIDLRSLGLLDLSQASSGPWADTLLFSGSQASTARRCPSPNDAADALPPAAGRRIDSSELDDMPLAQVAYMTSMPLASPHESKARRLTSALAKAAQLDGLRSFRKNKPDRWSHSPPVCPYSDESGSSSKQREGVRDSMPAKGSRKLFRFNELVAVYETWNRDEYDRRGMQATRLDPDLIEQIKKELNEYKSFEMPVHEASRQYTHFIC